MLSLVVIVEADVEVEGVTAVRGVTVCTPKYGRVMVYCFVEVGTDFREPVECWVKHFENVLAVSVEASALSPDFLPSGSRGYIN